MAKINIYLNFNGTCEDAFNFYKSVFGGEFPYIGRYSDMPEDSNTCPPDDLQKIMHISLPIGNDTVLMGCDTIKGTGFEFKQGNNFSIIVNTDSKEEADKVFNGLKAGGCIVMPLNTTFWGAYFGMVADQFGINWMVSFEKTPDQN
jgi:PhnB protein